MDQLEDQFDYLHREGYFLKNDIPEQFSNNPNERRREQKELQHARKNMNSHEFKYSMMPFSQFNNSIDVNLYS